MDKRTQDTIAWGLTFLVTLPVSALGVLYLASMSWLAYGALGIVVAGIAGALGIAAPYAAYGAHQCWRGNTEFYV